MGWKRRSSVVTSLVAVLCLIGCSPDQTHNRNSATASDGAAPAQSPQSLPQPSPALPPSFSIPPETTSPDANSSGDGDDADTDDNSGANSTDENNDDDDDSDDDSNTSDGSSFHGWPCTVDCSGHEAGYNWAEEHGITDPSDCGGNSQSFIEGCKAYAGENGPDGDNE